MFYRYRTAVILATLGLTACAQPGVQTSTAEETLTPITLTRAEQMAVEEGTRRGLKDPESARFGRMVAGARSNGTVVVCLMVNARNSFGGYTGEKPQMGLLFRDKTPMIFTLVSAPAHLAQYNDAAAFQVCKDRGLAL